MAYIVRAVGRTEGVSQERRSARNRERRLQGCRNGVSRPSSWGQRKSREALNAIFGEDYGSLVSVSQLAGSEDEINYGSIVIYAYPEILETSEEVVTQIDRPKPMVGMEALFVEAHLEQR